MLTILLTRHGKTPQSEPEQYLGQRMDVPLSDDGRATALALQARLAGVEIARVIASPLRRAMETAQILVPGGTIEQDARLVECDYGEWEGLTRDAIRARWPALRKQWEEDPGTVAPPGGESGEDVAHRLMPFVDSLITWEQDFAQPDVDRRVLLVGHSTVNRVLLAWRLGIPMRDYRRRLRQDWTNLTVLKYVSQVSGLLALDNDVSHIRGSRGVTWD